MPPHEVQDGLVEGEGLAFADAVGKFAEKEQWREDAGEQGQQAHAPHPEPGGDRGSGGCCLQGHGREGLCYAFGAMSVKGREHTGRQALAARMSAQFDRALSEAAETMETFGLGWDDIGPDDEDGSDDGDLLPLEFQLDDLEHAVDLLLQERDRFLYGDADGAAATGGKKPITGKED